MKKTLANAAALLMAFLVLIGTARSALAASALHPDYVAEKIYPRVVNSAWVQGDILYAVSRGKIVAFEKPGQNPVTVVDLATYTGITAADMEYVRLTGDNKALYLVNGCTGQVYVLEEDALREVVMLDISGQGKPAEGNRRYVTFYDPVVLDGFLYTLFMDPDTYSMAFCRFSLQSGAAEQIDLGDFDPYHISTYTDGELLLQEQSLPPRVARYDPRTGRLTIIMSMADEDSDRPVYDTESGRLYFLSNMQLMRYDGRVEPVDQFPVEDFIDYAGLWQGQYVALTGKGLYVGNTQENSGVQEYTLTLWADTSLNRDIVRAFQLAHPEILVNVLSGESENPLEKLTAESLSRSTNIDLFLMHSYSIDSQTIFDRGFAAPIESSALAADVKRMYPQVQEILTQSGQLMGYPLDLWLDFWTVRPDLLEKSGLGDVPETMADYCKMLLSWYDAAGAEGLGFTFDQSRSPDVQREMLVSLLVSQYIRTYGSGNVPISFNTPIFRDLLSQVAVLWNMPEDGRGFDAPSIFHIGSMLAPFQRGINSEAVLERYIQPPVFEANQEPVLSASLDYLIMNPNSQHQEEALLFLEFCMETRGLDDQYLLYPDFNDLLENDHYQENVQEARELVESLRASLAEWENQFEAIEHTRLTLMEQQPSIYDNPENPEYIEYMEWYHEVLDEGEIYRDHLAEAEANLALAESQRYVCAQEDIAAYRAVANFMDLRHSPMAWRIMEKIGANAILEKYLNGMASLDQVLAELDNRVAMMYYEGL